MIMTYNDLTETKEVMTDGKTIQIPVGVLLFYTFTSQALKKIPPMPMKFFFWRKKNWDKLFQKKLIEEIGDVKTYNTLFQMTKNHMRTNITQNEVTI